MKEEILSGTNVEEFITAGSGDVNSIVFVAGPGARVQSDDTLSFLINDSKDKEVVYEVDFNKIVNAVVSSMNSTASLAYKNKKFLEPFEIEKIKSSVDGNIEMIEELTKFQTHIQENYCHKLKEYNEEKIFCKTQIEMLEAAKHHIVTKRAAHMLWPFNEVTRDYDNKIAGLKIRVARCEQKMAAITDSAPAADEKDIMMFQVQLKRKFMV